VRKIPLQQSPKGSLEIFFWGPGQTVINTENEAAKQKKNDMNLLFLTSFYSVVKEKLPRCLFSLHTFNDGLTVILPAYLSVAESPSFCRRISRERSSVRTTDTAARHAMKRALASRRNMTARENEETAVH